MSDPFIPSPLIPSCFYDEFIESNFSLFPVEISTFWAKREDEGVERVPAAVVVE